MYHQRKLSEAVDATERRIKDSLLELVLAYGDSKSLDEKVNLLASMVMLTAALSASDDTDKNSMLRNARKLQRLKV